MGTMSKLTAAEVNGLDPYAFMAVIGKRVIHPGGRRSTEVLLERAGFQQGQRVLDVGCGVGTTAIEIARRFGANVTAVDISPLMLDRASANVHHARLDERVTVQHGDILTLAFPDNAFDHVIAEAVTMFVQRPAAARELVRVCKAGGTLHATEFLWRRTPSREARDIFLGEVCPGLHFDTEDDWVRVYQEAGLSDLAITSGPFAMMTPRGFLGDEGILNSVATMGRALSRPSYVKKMMWLMPRMNRAVPYLGYIAISGTKARPADTKGGATVIA